MDFYERANTASNFFRLPEFFLFRGVVSILDCLLNASKILMLMLFICSLFLL